MGMVGGGKDAFIGAIHRIAAHMDGLIELSCGALSINPDIAKESGEMLFLPAARTYLTYEEMIKKESELPAEQRIDFITIVTPNFAHFAPAMMALDHGFHVVIEKPMTFTLGEAKQLQQKVQETGLNALFNAYLCRLPHGKAGESHGRRRCVWQSEKSMG
jgi:predicted dehydrogenase